MKTLTKPLRRPGPPPAPKALVPAVIRTRADLALEIAALQTLHDKQTRPDFDSGVDVLFDTYPGLLSFGWRQYTPYFADGDELRFDANTEDVEINGYSDYTDDDDREGTGEDIVTNSRPTMYVRVTGGSGWNTISNPAYNERARDIVAAVQEFLGDFANEDFLKMFGEHTEVLVTRTGVTTSKYEHD